MSINANDYSTEDPHHQAHDVTISAVLNEQLVDNEREEEENQIMSFDFDGRYKAIDVQNYLLKSVLDYQRYENRGKVIKNNRNIRRSTTLSAVEQPSTVR